MKKILSKFWKSFVGVDNTPRCPKHPNELITLDLGCEECWAEDVSERLREMDRKEDRRTINNIKQALKEHENEKDHSSGSKLA